VVYGIWVQCGVAEDVFKIAGGDPLIEVAIALQVRVEGFV
jgi:hypothetical protein